MSNPSRVRPFAELRSSGVLWLVNASVFHPRGFAVALCYPEGADPEDDPTAQPIGWILLGDGSEPWSFGDDTDDEFAAARRLLSAGGDDDE